MSKIAIAIGLGLVLLSCQSGKMQRGSSIDDKLKENLNSLTMQEQQEGWKLLFDGKSLRNWRGFQQQSVPEGWLITKQGDLYFNGEGKGDIITKEQYEDFELKLEWKISPGGNSGIFFRVSEDKKATWSTGPEMQVLDNKGHKDGRNPKTSAGSNYALHAPSRDVTRKVGEYNQVRILAKGKHVEHWLNGYKIVEYELWSPEWEKLVANSKFASMPGYGRNRKGHIALQDHGDEVWYRNIKIRRL